jgi:hypothetical protein
MERIDIYTDLDSLLDTRLTTVFDKDAMLAKEILSNGSYPSRDIDKFGWMDRDTFNYFYSKRDKLCIKYSDQTNIQYLIDEYITYNSHKPDVPTPIKLYVNKFPYNINDEESETLRAGLSDMFPAVEVKLLNMSNSELKPQFISNNIGVMFKYDGLTWLEYHVVTGSVFDSSIVDTTLYVPELKLNSVIFDKKDSADIFDRMVHIAKPFIKLKFLSIVYFISTELTTISNTLE